MIDLLQKGNEDAFVALIDRYQTTMLRLAMLYVPERAIAEDVVQDAWIGVLRGLKHFERRSSLKVWISRILINCAKTRALREKRSVPFSSLLGPDVILNEPTVDPGRFSPLDSPSPGAWTSLPANWNELPEERFLSQETHRQLVAAIQALPASQRTVLTLRDLEGWTSEEVCNVLDISESNQRVLLHRARAKVRQALERSFTEHETLKEK
ncbi:RNA polymerase sigma factor [Dictyobacter aurantiacus]|uniref:RNA polymerase sigma factor n=1 Tax=Dictyobacter aurantiacus TaxID=1936993 RepID=UPI001C3F9987|nr:sigma-70 family RNA polymerase sigma factor [Dictyobacter aurantiacus]